MTHPSTDSLPPRPTKHEELTSELRGLALELSPGDRFPSQNELMRRYRVSDRTVLRSLDDLRREGVIVRRVGSGTFVADRRPEPAPRATRTVAVMALIDNPFFRHCVDELTRQASGAGLSVVCHYGDHHPRIEEALALEALRPAGFLLFSYIFAPVAVELRARGHRVVIVGVTPPGVTAAVPNVSGDHEYGGYIATRRLLDLGHRRIAYARHFQDVEMLTETRRWRGHLRALAEAGLLEGGEGAARILSVLEWRRMHAAEGAAERLRAAYRELDSPTAVACWTDHEAGLLLPPLTAAGLSVPGDVSLIGYDNVPLGESLSPSLDTVDPHTDVLVRRALDLLGDPQTADPGFAPQVSVTPTLHPRHSCAPPKKE